MKRKVTLLCCGGILALATVVMAQSPTPPGTGGDKDKPATLFPFSNEAGLYGYTDARGGVVIKAQFLMAEDFSEGLARVGICTDYGRREGFIDASGAVVIEPKFDWAADFSEGLAAVVTENGLGFIDRTGRMVVEPQFQADTLELYKFCEGLAAVRVGNKWGYIDRVGQFVVKPKFDVAGHFSDGMAEVEINHKSGYINTAGKLVVKPRFDNARGFSEGLAPVNIGYTYGLNYTAPGYSKGRWGYIDRFGTMIVAPKFEWAGNFSEGRAHVSVDGISGFIDKTGQLAIEAKYDDAWEFSEGLAPVELDGKWGYIDLNGKIVIPFKFKDARSFRGGFATVNDFESRIDRNGEIIWTERDESRSFADAECKAKIQPPPPTAEELARWRREIHERMLKGEYQHDGAGELIEIGDLTSVPALLRVLKDHAPKSDGGMVICTYSHAVAALQRITGQKLFKYEDWRLWWESYQETHGKVTK